MEGSLTLASHALVLLGVPLRRVVHTGANGTRCALRIPARIFPRASDVSDDAENMQLRVCIHRGVERSQ